MVFVVSQSQTTTVYFFVMSAPSGSTALVLVSQQRNTPHCKLKALTPRGPALPAESVIFPVATVPS